MRTRRRSGWKVVTHAWQRCTGYTGVIVPTVVYQKGVIAKRPLDAGPLCVFTSLKEAREFAPPAASYIFRCLYVPSKDTHVWRGCSRRRRHLAELPHSTALADTVELVGEPIEIGGDR